jgi:hypothetical protein
MHALIATDWLLTLSPLARLELRAHTLLLRVEALWLMGLGYGMRSDRKAVFATS